MRRLSAFPAMSVRGFRTTQVLHQLLLISLMTAVCLLPMAAVADEPAPSPTVPQEQGTTGDPSQVQERAVIRGQFEPVPVTPPRTPGTPAPKTGVVLMSTAAPPPLGPPAPTDPIGDISVFGVLTPLVKGQVTQALVNVNATAASGTSVRAQVSLSDFTVWSPWLDATHYTDRPNEQFVRVPYMMTFYVHDIQKHTSLGWVGVPVERHISQAIDMLTFCDKWQAGQGNLKLVSDIQKPYLEDDQGTLEEVVNFFVANTLTSYIDSQVRQQLTQPANVSVSLPGQCNSLGAFAGQANDPTDDTIQFSFHKPRTVVATGGLTVFDQITVKLLSLKRLAAHDMHGAVLYKAVEAPALEFYANYQHYYAPLSSLQEGQQVTLNVPPFALPRPGGSGLVVLISNIIQNLAINTQPTDSAFRVFDQNTNFGNGTQTMRIQKGYWVQANPQTGAKPYQIFVDAYELAFQVNAPQPMANDGMVTSPGTIGPGTTGTGTVLPGRNATIMRRGVEDEQPTPSPQPEPSSGTTK